MALINGMIKECLLAIGNRIKCMEKVNSHGKMGKNIKDNTKKIKNMVMEYLVGQMVNLLVAIGRMENNMEKELMSIVKGKNKKEIGLMVKDLNDIDFCLDKF